MSQNTNLGNRADRGTNNLNNVTNNTDQNLQENFGNGTQINSYYDQRAHRGGHDDQDRHNQAQGERYEPGDPRDRRDSPDPPAGHNPYPSSVPSTIYHQNSQYRHPKDLVNNTNDLNPMIMMSGEDGSASPTGQSQSMMNITNMTQGPGGFAGQ
jgi:hypothetical protein